MKTITGKLLWTSCAAALLALAPACDGDENKADACGEPLYGGDATDEAWRTLVDAKGLATAGSDSVTLESPTAGQTYSSTDAPPTWRWTSPLASVVPGPGPGSVTPSHPARPREERRSVLAWLGNLVLPSAEAHLPPFTGDIYWVQVTVPGRQCPVEMLTSNLEWRLDAATWDTLRGSVDQDLTVQVTSAYLLQNKLTEGPFRLEAPRTIRVVGAR
ncbi:hypothetical protein HPC49_51415 [Pyxidicoccus fallax]|uniref:Lipoprotein n=1 Tax=Pyxidicoccus fallax TaxID=394095 RepID=A0A848LKF0_9BACT|nr:hypothetical protein [Pyxidicoccus fallax]NMO18186.1 hypothetical protein [Pyxidicoccus fallax]NPC86583.1 hypothetical protein [Pyxidicoccus fallax]